MSLAFTTVTVAERRTGGTVGTLCSAVDDGHIDARGFWGDLARGVRGGGREAGMSSSWLYSRYVTRRVAGSQSNKGMAS